MQIINTSEAWVSLFSQQNSSQTYSLEELLTRYQTECHSPGREHFSCLNESKWFLRIFLFWGPSCLSASFMALLLHRLCQQTRQQPEPSGQIADLQLFMLDHMWEVRISQSSVYPELEAPGSPSLRSEWDQHEDTSCYVSMEQSSRSFYRLCSPRVPKPIVHQHNEPIMVILVIAAGKAIGFHWVWEWCYNELVQSGWWKPIRAVLMDVLYGVCLSWGRL